MPGSMLPNARRFDGFADAYDAHRPSPPGELGPLLARYAGVEQPEVVDLGSGTGLSSRWAAGWAATVVGIEPSVDMRAAAERRPLANLTYRDGTSEATGLPDACADIVLAVQAMHWMEPDATHAEVCRLLRPGGVFATVDADWPPVTGLAAAELAWRDAARRIRLLEERAHHTSDLAELRRDGVAALPARSEDHHDPHKDRLMPGGAVSWSKGGHLERLTDSGRFAYTREICMQATEPGGAERFVAVLRSQASYRGLAALGLTDDEMGVADFEAAVHAAFAASPEPLDTISFTWRIRLGVIDRRSST